jgi:hypothetical protein
MLVDPERLGAISVQFDYRKAPDGALIQTQIDDPERRRALWEEDLRSYALMMNDRVAG